MAWDLRLSELLSSDYLQALSCQIPLLSLSSSLSFLFLEEKA